MTSYSLFDPLFPDIVGAIPKRFKKLTNPKLAHAWITPLTQKITRKDLLTAPNLKVIGNIAVGVDNIDLRVCKELGISVVNTPDVLTRSTSELTLALLFAVARRLPEGEAVCRKNRFPGWDLRYLLGKELHGSTATIVGPGRIGKEVSRLFRAIGLKTRFVSRKTPERKIKALFAKSDVVSLHLPYTASTHHWLSAKRISYLGPHSILLNVARGPIIDEASLIQALQKKKLWGAGLDVFEEEPKIPAKLRALKNVVLLPHLGSATLTARKAMARLACQGVIQVLKGKKPRNLVIQGHRTFPKGSHR